MSRTLLNSVVAIIVLAGMLGTAAADDKKAKEQRRRQAEAQLKTLEREEGIIRKQIDGLKKQVPQLEKRLVEFQKQVQVMQAQVKMATDILDQTKRETKVVDDELQRVVEGVLGEQPAESPFALLRAEYQAAQKNYLEILEEIERTPEYQAAYREAKAKGGARVLAVRQKFFDKNPTVVSAREDMANLKKQGETLRLEILRESESWKHASNKLKTAKEHLLTIDNQTKSVVGRYTTAVRQVNSTKSAIRKLQAKIRKGQQVLSQVVATKNNVKRFLGRK